MISELESCRLKIRLWHNVPKNKMLNAAENVKGSFKNNPPQKTKQMKHFIDVNLFKRT